MQQRRRRPSLPAAGQNCARSKTSVLASPSHPRC
jgi:hypothetical protein